ncbi:unnamed protein product [Urochloa decumbens]|uniref:Uncharacterized protein n=1 Tax=Urochloa decumbens TaxID=240449 RepID=A0ABC8VEF4_9POAL
MAVLPRLPRALAFMWLAVALLLAATSGCLCRPHVTPTPLTPPPAGDAPPAHHVPVPVHPRPICRGAFCTPRLPPIRICPPEGCSGEGPP